MANTEAEVTEMTKPQQQEQSAAAAADRLIVDAVVNRMLPEPQTVREYITAKLNLASIEYDHMIKSHASTI